MIHYRQLLSHRFIVVLLGVLLGATISDKSSALHAMMTKKNMVNPEIMFEKGTWNTIIAKAKKEHKYIFVDAYAEWCGPCKQLKATTFKDKNVANYFNNHFVNVSLDVEKGEGVGLATKWNVDAYPTLLIVDPSGKIVVRRLGYVDAGQLVDFGKHVAMQKEHMD